MMMLLDYRHTLGISEKLIKTKNLINTIYICIYTYIYIYIYKFTAFSGFNRAHEMETLGLQMR